MTPEQVQQVIASCPPDHTCRFSISLVNEAQITMAQWVPLFVVMGLVIVAIAVAMVWYEKVR